MQITGKLINTTLNFNDDGKVWLVSGQKATIELDKVDVSKMKIGDKVWKEQIVSAFSPNGQVLCQDVGFVVAHFPQETPFNHEEMLHKKAEINEDLMGVCKASQDGRLLRLLVKFLKDYKKRKE